MNLGSQNSRLHSPAGMFSRIALFQMLGEKGREFVPRNEVHPVVEIDVTRTWNDVKLLRFRRFPEGVLAEDARMRMLSGDEQHWSRRNPVKALE